MPSLLNVAKKWFGVDSEKHPGVLNFLSRGSIILQGKPFFNR